MASLETILVVAALCGAPDTVLLSFHSEHCGPCRTMSPVVQRLSADGYPVQAVNVEEQPELATRYAVKGIPCFVLVSGGREVDRVVGATSRARLERMFVTINFRPANSQEKTPFAQQHPGEPSPQAKPVAMVRSEITPASDRISDSPAGGGPRPNSTIAGLQPPTNRSVVQRALEATVRIRVDDGQGQSWGTGTIIDTHGDEALIVTCGHIFRESRGKGKIQIDLFAPGAKNPVPAQLIGYEATERDIGLIAIRPGITVKAVPVATTNFQTSSGDHVFSIGCDKGGSPSVRTSQVNSLGKYLGAPNVQVAGQPIDGRSGGGLFSADGQLFGICNAADPQDDEGVYASWPNIHWQLAQVGLERLFEVTENVATNPPARNASTASTNSVLPPTMPSRMSANAKNTASQPVLPASTHQSLVAVISNNQQQDTEVICIVRSRSKPDGASQTFVLNEPSSDFLERLNVERRSRGSTERLASGLSRAAPADSRPPAFAPEATGRIIRAQSGDE